MSEPSGSTTPQSAGTISVELLRGSEIIIEPITWMWEGWLAAGKLHMMGGAPGTGKTTLAMALAAILTRGGIWPDGSPVSEAGDVVVWSGEDDAGDTLAPRLKAMSADLDRIHFITGSSDGRGKRAFDPANDMEHLVRAVHDIENVRMLIVDPVVSMIAGDSHKNAEVRRGLAPLVDFAQQMRAAVLGITHFTKGTEGKSPIDRLTGSLAFGAAPRLVFATSKIRDGGAGDGHDRVLARVKSNIGPDGGGLTYKLMEHTLDEGVIASSVSWGSCIDGSAHDILSDAENSKAKDGSSALLDAQEFLESLLASGPLESTRVMETAKEHGISAKTLRRAGKALGISVTKLGMTSGWQWELPNMASGTEGSHSKQVGSFDGHDHLR